MERPSILAFKAAGSAATVLLLGEISAGKACCPAPSTNAARKKAIRHDQLPRVFRQNWKANCLVG